LSCCVDLSPISERAMCMSTSQPVTTGKSAYRN